MASLLLLHVNLPLDTLFGLVGSLLSISSMLRCTWSRHTSCVRSLLKDTKCHCSRGLFRSYPLDMNLSGNRSRSSGSSTGDSLNPLDTVDLDKAVAST